MLASTEEWLSQIQGHCETLPEAYEERATPDSTSFRVRTKIYAYFLVNHHGDGRVAIWCKALPGVQQALVAGNPASFFVPPYVGHNGWIGIRFDGAAHDWDEVRDLVEQSYRMTAPKKLVTLLDVG